MSHHSKFVSVNLNKSYGHGHVHPSSSSSTFAHGRGRGMVVLSRPRSSGASGPKLSVPPPLNLPSLRKEHERLDPSSAPARPSGPGSGAGSSAMGWTKPGLLPDGDSGGPPGKSSGARPVTVGKAVLLRGEDFPSLHATVAKQKDALKQKQAGQESTIHGRTERTELQDPLDMRPQLRSSHLARRSGTEKDEGSRRPSSAPEQPPKSSGYLSGLLPLVRLPQRSDWADDERDTGLGVSERERDRGFDSGRDFDDGRGTSREFFSGDVADPSRDARDGSSWRATPQPRNGFGFREVGVDRYRFAAKPSGANRETGKDSSYSHLPRVDNAQDGFGNGVFDSRYSRRDMGPGTSFQNGRNVADMYSERAASQNQHGHYDDLSSNRYRDSSSFSSGSKGFSFNDPILNFSRESRLMSETGEPYLDGGGLYGSDPFSGSLVFKRKKDALKQTDFHDPVRESFEAELERVQRMQELERQRMMEEQAKASEIARRERQERERLAREEEERRRRVEEEAREAVWRAEQERLEAAKRSEEQKITREEQRRRIVIEEERRKEAARQKLLELEARIAKRQAETSVKDDRFPSSVSDERLPVLEKERDVLRAADIGEWEDGERMVEHITNTISSDFSSMKRYFDTGTRTQYTPDEKYSYMETGRYADNWRRDTHENGNNSIFLSRDQDNGYHSPRRDVFATSRGFSKNEIQGNLGPPARALSKGGTPEASYVPDDFHQSRGNKWNSAGDGDYFSRNSNTDADILDNNKFGDVVWGSGSSHGTPHASYAERSFENSEVDEFLTLGRSHHSLKQLRVLPPASVSSMCNGPFRPLPDHHSSSSFYDSEMRYQHTGKSEEAIYNHVYQEKVQQPATAVVTVSLAESTISAEQKVDTNSLRCDSQSSLSVSSPPASPTHLSHEDLDESEDSQVLSISAVRKQTDMSGDGQTVPADTNSMVTLSSLNYGEDDEWATENHETMVEQEEYNEDNNGYQEEEEAHKCSVDNLDPDQEFDDIRPEVPDASGEVGQTVLGFHEGVENTNGEFEKTSRTSEMTIAAQESSVGAVYRGVDVENAFLEGTVTDSSKIINETEKALQDMVLDLGSPADYTLDTVEASGISGMLAQLHVSSEVSSSMLSTSSGQPILSPVSTSSVQPMLLPDSAVATQPEGPIELQFGLFCGPSLLPSPVPSIQIGSIQLPLHLPQVGPSISQLYSSQASFFQFGQLRYTSPISHGILPLSPQPMSFVQPPALTYSLDHRLVGSVHNQESQGSSSNSRDKVISAPTLQHPSPVAKHFDVSQNNTNYKINAPPDASQNGVTSKNQIGGSSFVDVRSRSTSSSKDDVASRNHSSGSSFVEVRSRYASASRMERHGNVTVRKSYRPVAHNKEYQVHAEHNSSRFFPGEKGFSRSKAAGMVSGSRGKRFAYTARNAGSRTSNSGQDMPKADSNGFQRRAQRNIRRTEFRVRENADRRQTEGLEPFSSSGQNGKPNFNPEVQGNSASYGGKQDAGLSKSTQMMLDPENSNSGVPNCLPATSDSNMDQLYCKDTASKKRMSSVDNSHGGGRNTKRNGSSEDDVDAPLQSNIVRVFKQPGIETPKDEDDFIQVRSKRQMLNDKRVQREREIKADSRALKPPQKMRPAPRSTAVTSKSNKSVASLVGEGANDVRFGSSFTVGRGFSNVETSLCTAAVASQSLPPIGTPSTKKDSDAKAESLISSQPITIPMVSSNGSNFSPGLSADNNNRAFDSSPMPLDFWGNPGTNHKVIALTQSQLDEAMQPAHFDSHAAISIAHEPTMASTSIIMQEKHFSSEKTYTIQFGAVTSPIILPAVSRASSNGIGINASGSGRSDVAMVPKLPSTENSCSVFLDKEKCLDEFSARSMDAEAEAAASAVAVAAISNTNELVGNRLSACSVSVSDTKNLNASDASLLTSKEGVTVSQYVTGQFAAEDSLTVSLPADLSVDTPSLPFCPPLPSSQSSSGPILSHFPAAPPTRFPCFEISPMLRGPIYAFGSHDESAGSQRQSQSTTLGSGPPGAWPQCHATMDSFYGPPAGFTGPFISPPGGIPGIQGPNHMIVYNHFAPVGQFGHVGLSFMGTTYIPTGKQHDWKHNPVSSAVGVGESDISNLNVVSGPYNPPGMAAPIQHMAPGSIMQMAPPLTMFDMSSFQSSADVPLQARWSHVSDPPIRSVPLSIHLQQHQMEGIASHFSRSLPVDNSVGNHRFSEPRAVMVSDGNRNLSVPKDGASQFPAELIPSTITDSVRTCGSSSSVAGGNDNKGTKTSKSLAIRPVSNVSESHVNGASNTNSGGQIVGYSSESQAPQQYASSRKQYPHAVQRGSGTSQKVASGGEWHHRTGYQGRKQAPGSDRKFSSSKMKQIYVVKSQGGAAVTG